MIDATSSIEANQSSGHLIDTIEKHIEVKSRACHGHTRAQILKHNHTFWGDPSEVAPTQVWAGGGA